MERRGLDFYFFLSLARLSHFIHNVRGSNPAPGARDNSRLYDQLKLNQKVGFLAAALAQPTRYTKCILFLSPFPRLCVAS